MGVEPVHLGILLFRLLRHLGAKLRQKREQNKTCTTLSIFLKILVQSEKCNFCNLHFSRCFLRGARLLHYSINITLLYFIFIIRYPHVSPPPTTPKVQVAKVAKLTNCKNPSTSVNKCIPRGRAPWYKICSLLWGWSPTTVETNWRFIWSCSEIDKMISRTDPMIWISRLAGRT